MNVPRRVAILGAGPIGVEAALAAAARGFEVELFERGQVGQHVLQWGHVRFFSPWSLNASPLGLERLAKRGCPSPAPDHFPTGLEFVRDYLAPLAADPWLQGRVHTQTSVLGIARAGALKGHHIARPERASSPFVLLVRQGDQERYVEADLVLDATGAYGQPNPLGLGGLAALGEADVSEHIERYIPDALGQQRPLYEGKRTLVIGAGYSAITSLELLLTLQAQAPGTELTWLVQGHEPPYEVLEDDPLPQRRHLAQLGNGAFIGQRDGVRVLGGARVESLRRSPQGDLEVTLLAAGQRQTLRVDRVIANVGYRPDVELYRELQVHQCYASEGPMKLAAALLSASAGGGGDCLAQTSQGVDALKSPEPHFYIIGAKSYGRGSAFLLKIGLAQIAEILDHLRPHEGAAE